MSDDLLKNVYNKVDTLLKLLRDKGSGSLYDIGELYDTEGQMAKNLLVDHGLISFQMGYVSTKSIIDIAQPGLNVLKAGGIEKYLLSINQSKEERENLELQKLRSENEKLVNDLVEFPKIKLQRKWLLIIAIIELLAIIVGLILQSKGKS